MPRTWNSAAELSAMMRMRASKGKNVVLSPETALIVAALLDPPQSGKQDSHRIDPYSEGSAIYRLDREGEIAEVVAFARNALVARAAFDYLCEREPNESYSQRRRSWVEADRIVPRGSS